MSGLRWCRYVVVYFKIWKCVRGGVGVVVGGD